MYVKKLYRINNGLSIVNFFHFGAKFMCIVKSQSTCLRYSQDVPAQTENYN